MSTPNQAGQPGGSKPAEADRYEVLMAAYLFVAPGRKDYDAIMKLVKDHAITVEGAVLVSKDHAGEMHIEEGGEGLVIGLLEPRWLAKTALGRDVGALATKFGKQRADSGIEKKLNETLGAGNAVSDGDLRPRRRRRRPQGRHEFPQDLIRGNRR